MLQLVQGYLTLVALKPNWTKNYRSVIILSDPSEILRSLVQF
ncbi:MAG: hypothetical protein ACPK7O_07375 [Methanobacterium sp.]